MKMLEKEFEGVKDKKTMMQGLYYVKSLTGQRHDRVQTESQELQQWTATSTLLGLVSAQ